MNLSGKKALVTGAAKRVGREIALGLARKGVDILLHYNTSAAEAEKTASEIRSHGVQCSLFQANLLKTTDISRMVKTIFEKTNQVDILVNSASSYYKTPIRTVTEAAWDELMDANLKAPFFLSKEMGSRMFDRGGGKIVNISDWSGIRPYRDFAPYCAAKGGLITLTKSLARDFAPKIQANAIAPGPILPPPDMPEEEKEIVAKSTVLGRWGAPADIANAVIFLLENDFINGTVLVVDGGRSII